MDTGLMGEGVLADDRLVWLRPLPRELRQHLTGRVQLAGVDLGLKSAVEVRPDLQRHHYLFDRGVASPLADAVDAALDLARAGLDRRQRVGNGHPEVVVAVDRDGRLVRVLDLAPDPG